MKRDCFLDYYTEINNHILGSFSEPWKFQIKSGTRFTPDGNLAPDQPIPFVVFFDQKDNRICRVPLSPASLLETTATSAELNFQVREIVKLDSPFKENQLQALNKKIESKLYNPDLAIYSVAVHLTSVLLQIKDPVTAYRISSVFAKIALNMPSALFKGVKNGIVENAGEVWLERTTHFLSNCDRGWIFHILISNYQKKFGTIKDADTLVEDILIASALPKEATMQEMISDEITSQHLELTLQKNTFDRLVTDKLYNGTQFRFSTGIGQQNRHTKKIIDKFRDQPYLMFSDTYFEYENLDLHQVYIKAAHQQSLTIEEWTRLYSHCETKIDLFNEICGI